ncbi:hypothetical protein M5D96_003019, partial [Drosophila gunungcola]
ALHFAFSFIQFFSFFAHGSVIGIVQKSPEIRSLFPDSNKINIHNKQLKKESSEKSVLKVANQCTISKERPKQSFKVVNQNQNLVENKTKIPPKNQQTHTNTAKMSVCESKAVVQQQLQQHLQQQAAAAVVAVAQQQQAQQ